MSQHIAHLKPGETLSFKGPIAKYAYKPNEFAHGFAIGGGSGITPMYQMISHSLTLPNDNTKWTLMFANVTDKDIRGFFRRVN
jgi:NAD(P)H-flavin reductase